MSEFKIVGIRMPLILVEMETYKGKVMSCLNTFTSSTEKLNRIFFKHEFPFTIILHNQIMMFKH